MSASSSNDVRRRIRVDGRTYQVDVSCNARAALSAPRLVVVSYLPNAQALGILKTFIQAVRHFTPEPHELWVVDNASPPEHLRSLREFRDVNLAMSRTTPVPPGQRLRWALGRRHDQSRWGSYANGVGLEIGRAVVDAGVRFFAAFHMDTMPVREGWLSTLIGKFEGDVGAVGVRLDATRVPGGVLHPVGSVFDLPLIEKLRADFLPELPGFDVADRVSVALREAGYELVALPNTFSDPTVADRIHSPRFTDLPVDRCLDEAGNVIFLHLGRGVRKTTGQHSEGTSPAAWMRLAEELMAD